MKCAEGDHGLSTHSDAGPITGAPADTSCDPQYGPAAVTPAPVIAPRFIRLRDAPRYFGMNKNLFNQAIRPQLTVIRIGVQGRAFDRLEMDLAAEEYKRRNGVPVALSMRRKPLWETEERQVSPNAVRSGMSTSNSEAHAFAKALELATYGKHRSISRSG
jgi:hypothetical protein